MRKIDRGTLTSLSLFGGFEAMELAVESLSLRHLRETAGITESIDSISIVIVRLSDEAVGGWAATAEEFAIVIV